MPCISGRDCNVPLCDCEDTCGDFVIPTMVIEEPDTEDAVVIPADIPDIDTEIDDNGPTGAGTISEDGEYLDYDYGYYYDGQIFGYYDFYFGYFYDSYYGEYYDGLYYNYYYDISPYYTEMYHDYSMGQEESCDDWYDYEYGSYWDCDENTYYNSVENTYYESVYGSWTDNYYNSYYDGNT